MGQELKLPKVMWRSVEIDLKKLDRAEGDTEDTRGRYEIAISSEFPVQRWFGTEVLSHDKSAVDLTRLRAGAAVLVDHYSDQVGVVESARVDDDKVLRGVVRFSANARGQEIERDVVDKIRRHISVGYMPIRAKLVEQSKDGKKADTWRITRWQPMEVSFVSVPADPSVGVGRGVDSTGLFPVEVEVDKPVEEEVRAMDPVIATTSTGTAPVFTSGEPAITPEVRFAEIAKFAHEQNLGHKVADWISRGLSLGECALEALADKSTRGGAASPKGLDLTPKQEREYSYVRAIAGCLEMRAGGKFDGFEREVHDEMSRSIPSGYPYQGGVFVPIGESRSLDSKTLGKGSEFVSEQAGPLIEQLRNRSVVASMGARTLTGLGAPIAFSKQKTGMTFYWMGENPAAAVTASDIGLGLANLAPKTLMGQGSFSRQLLILGNKDVEGMVRDEIAIGHALAIDNIAIHGIGAAGIPMGIYYAADVNAQAMSSAVPTFPLLVAMETAVAVDNAAIGALGWVTTPQMAGVFRTTPQHATYPAANWMWEGNMLEGSIAGYRAMASNQISATMSGSAETGGAEQGIIFGNWNDLIIGMFSGLEIIVDPYTDAGKAMVKLTSFQMADVLTRHGQSFAKSTAATLS